MSYSIKEPTELERIYANRFGPSEVEYRRKIWKALIDGFFQKLVPPSATVLDLGCGFGEFINQIECRQRLGMDLNPGTRERLHPDVRLLQQDCSKTWDLPDNSLDIVFTSNFFEHLPDKEALKRTLEEAIRCLRPGGKLIALGPNIRHLADRYWDFWDHFLPLTERSLTEGMVNEGFEIVRVVERFLPYTTVGERQYRTALVRLYLWFKPAWRIFGRQFLVVARKPNASDTTPRNHPAP